MSDTARELFPVQFLGGDRAVVQPVADEAIHAVPDLPEVEVDPAAEAQARADALAAGLPVEPEPADSDLGKASRGPAKA